MDIHLEPLHLSFLERNVAQQRWHYLNLHDSDIQLADNICRFLGPALRPGHAAVIVATPAHIRLVRERAPVFNLDLPAAEARGQLVVLDARELLDRFMVNGMPDRTRFDVILTGLLKNVASEFPKLHIYGEMVALLMEEGNVPATQMLEELWNDLGRMRPFALLCGYPRSAFASPEQADLMERICNCHTHVFSGDAVPVMA